MILELGGGHRRDVTHRAVVVGDLPVFAAAEWRHQMGALKQAGRGMIEEGASLLCLDVPVDLAANESAALLRSFMDAIGRDVPVAVHSRNEPALLDALYQGATAVIVDSPPRPMNERSSLRTDQTMWILRRTELCPKGDQELAEVLEGAQGLAVISVGGSDSSGAIVAAVVAGCRILRTRRVRSVRRIADVVAVMLRERDRDFAVRAPGVLR